MRPLIKPLLSNRLTWKASIMLVALFFLSCESDDFCESCRETNQPPTAIAGPDQVITLPNNSILLDGSSSTDPEGISSYNWKKIEGPDSFLIISPKTAKTMVQNLAEGIYQFELEVMNTGGLFTGDTIKVTVHPPDISPTNSTPITCDNSERPQVFAQLIPIGSLSKSRIGFAVASAGSKIVFAGGLWTLDCPECWGSSRVDIYDTNTQEWTIAELSEGRHGIATIAVGNKIFFAGGANGDGAFDTLFSTVDIYDASTGNWSVTNLSKPRAYIAAAAVGNKVFFAGGEKDWDYQTSNTVDIYDMANNKWSAHSLSEARAYISAVSVNNKVYFAGGHKEDRWYKNPTDKIDIYDNATGTWSTSSLSQPMGMPAGIASGQDIYWASGCHVEIKNVDTWNSSMASLIEPGEPLFDSRSIIMKDGKLVFVRNAYGNGTNNFDIYDTSTKTWSIGMLPGNVSGASVLIVNNTIYLTSKGQSTNLWKLEF